MGDRPVANGGAESDRTWELQARAETSHFWFRGFRAFVTPVLQEIAGDSPDLRILDGGCGTGNNIRMLLPYGRVFGYELAAGGLPHARRAGRPIARGDATAVPFRADTFDLVTLFDVLPCVDDDGMALHEAARVLRPGGTLILTVAAFKWLRGDHAEAWSELHRYTAADITRLVRHAGLQPTRTSFLFASTFPLFVVARTWQRLSRPWRECRPDIDIGLPPAPVNAVLTTLVTAEAALARRIAMPIGSSLLVVARKPSGRLQ